ncbi:unnamed protein product [Clonostachys rosea]|uniref:Xylanolytic transcriptional activator regulatory domain-containing protein n=1 Tax=Bionectria ochroleuca TaxID=29856 RepID=A0ABY6U585_BIOOC|nr:unnamed protein product [Clonostachys rosea]
MLAQHSRSNDNQLDGSTIVEASPEEYSNNPLVDNGETFARDPFGKYCTRISEPDPPIQPWDLETIDLAWNPIGLNEQPDISDLPSKDYALFLISTAQYYLAPFAKIIDHPQFRKQTEDFYENPAIEARKSRMWYSQFLFTLAFGEAYAQTGSSQGIPGIQFASRALSLIPSIVPMEKNPLAAVEALCLGALYLQSLDLRLMSFQLVKHQLSLFCDVSIGHALRICVSDGLHRHMPTDHVSLAHSNRCNTVFWIAYIIDRDFSTLVGAPSSIRDEDITTKLPSEIDDSMNAAAMTLQIRLSRLTATILTGVYGVDKNFDGSLLRETQSVLHKLAAVCRDLTSYLGTTLHGTNIKTSKLATRLILSYHHCVVLTTRPLVMCVLQRRIALGDDKKTIPEGPISSLLQSCAHSALNILRALETLGDNNLLDSFLPFQLETAWSSAFLLQIIVAVAPTFVEDRTWLAAAHRIFDMMIARGSPAARLRKRDFQRLEHIMASYLREGEGNSSAQDSSCRTPGQGGGFWDPNLSSEMEEFSPWGLLGSNGNFAISPNEILNLTEGLNMEDFLLRE